MALEIDLSTTDKRAHERYNYPEGDEKLKRRMLLVAERCVSRFEVGSGDIMDATEELYAVTHELRERGYEVSISVEDEEVSVHQKT